MLFCKVWMRQAIQAVFWFILSGLRLLPVGGRCARLRWGKKAPSQKPPEPVPWCSQVLDSGLVPGQWLCCMTLDLP